MHPLPKLIASYAWLPGLLITVAHGTPHTRGRPLDPAARVDFTVTGGGHEGEQVRIRDAYPEEEQPAARYSQSGIMYGIDGPILSLRAGKLASRLWAVHFLLDTRGGDGAALPVVSPQPALIYHGDNSARQQSWYPLIDLPPLTRGTLTVKVLPGGPPGRVRGTFAGTLVDEHGVAVTVADGRFDLARLPDGP